VNEKGELIMDVREGLLYTKSHEWIKMDGEIAWIGLTDFAQSELGNIVFVNLPEEDDSVIVGESFADVESVKAVSDVFSPVSGNVIEINEELQDSPEKINEEPYEAWFVKIGDVTDKEEFLTASEYEAFLAKENH
jgi:glycine cleavage system H protein